MTKPTVTTRAAVIDPATPGRVKLYYVEVYAWRSPGRDFEATLVLPTHAHDMAGPDAVPAVCEQLGLPVPQPGDGPAALVGAECPARYRKAVAEEVMRGR